MQVSGNEAKGFDAVRLDSFVPANRGELVFADDQTGEVRWKDGGDSLCAVTLGQHAIRILSRRR